MIFFTSSSAVTLVPYHEVQTMTLSSMYLENIMLYRCRRAIDVALTI